MARIYVMLTPVLIVVVASAYPTTTERPKTLTPHHKTAGGTEKDALWKGGRKAASQDMSHTRKLSRQKRQLGAASQDMSHTRKLSRWKRQAASNWFTRMYLRKWRALKKFFHSHLWRKYRQDMGVSSVFIVMSTSLDAYFHSLRLGDIGSISTYMDFFWASYDILRELKKLADKSCFYPTYWPLYKLAPDHCNPYRELQQLLDKADQLPSTT